MSALSLRAGGVQKTLTPHTALRPLISAVRAWDALVLAYFAGHIPATLLVDAQVLLPAAWAGALPARPTLRAYCAVLQDPLMCAAPPAAPWHFWGGSGAPAWFVAIVAAEVALQLPLFFAALAAWRASPRPTWLRRALAAYGAHTATTLVPILATFWAAGAGCAGGLAPWRVAALTAVYAPFLIMPLALLAHALDDAQWPPAALPAAATAPAPAPAPPPLSVARGRAASSAARHRGASRSPAARGTPRVKVD